ncbi:type VII secretion integral membrane protein EccD [Corynebacterium sp.]|uniref:type VII secretion integral membrane protein EccD n=1 Tax=Corynebacterium sp. TaxID=1720 RepID=UPI0026E0CA77|nr:type VII secretion integral membrane protein EccD [Corynebacterium sp.]MDO5512750.1 type VII secretion integral membrane protein EccD [Corynebacterium sp.]
MSVDHVLRLTMRFQIGSYHQEADVAVPAGSSLGEVIPEIVALVEAPRISRPWLATTAGGSPLDLAVPLHQTPLDHGSVVVLTPRHAGSLPVIRDSAEALAESAADAATHGLPVAGAVTGTAVFLILAVVHLPWSQALAAAALAPLAVLIACRHRRALAPCVLVLSGAAAAALVLESARPGEMTAPATTGAASLAAAGATGATLVLLLAIGGIGARTTAATAAVLGVGSLGALGFLLPAHAAHPPVAAAALLVAGGVVFMSLLPGLATRAAGLQVPRLPTAGQEMAVADEPPGDVTGQARRARRLHEGAALGAASLLAPALLYLGSQGGAFTQALCTAVAGAVLLHALRHRQPVAAWAWMTVGLSACVGIAWAAADPGHPLQWALAAAVGAATLSAPLWADRVPRLEPTAVVWWERAESLSLAATLPLAAHLAGMFVLIRGLG